MMNRRIVAHPVFGKCLYADNGIIEVGIPLDFGLRIGHFSFLGEENVFYEHPNDTEIFTTEEGWRLRGGHRMWIAPESPKVYCPDNAPISWRVEGETLILTQQEDPRLKVIKEFRLTLEGSQLKITHRVQNTGTEPLIGAVWAISVMAPGGTETIDLQLRDGGMDHWHRISMWDYTSLGDPRATYTRERITLRHLPIEDKYKIGVGHPFGPVRYENGNTVFVKEFPILPEKEYPDGNVSYEAFFSKYMTEMESLSPLHTLQPGQWMEHQETLTLLRKEPDGKEGTL